MTQSRGIALHAPETVKRCNMAEYSTKTLQCMCHATGVEWKLQVAVSLLLMERGALFDQH